MEKVHTIYLGDQPLIITQSATNIQKEGLEVWVNPDFTKVQNALDQLEAGQRKGLLIEMDHPQELFQSICSRYEVAVAGGGIITNPDGALLLMFRRGKWDLPKGKQDPGERIEDCALREVREETGLSQVRLGDKILETFHYYEWKGQKMLKHSVWFRMYFTGTEQTIPQIEEDIMDIQWIAPEHIQKYMPYSYPNIEAVIRAAGY
jgi:8-oxo-dGTP pyrophosphatase MutT (NUDIX family)